MALAADRTRARPWRIDITHPDEGTVVVAPAGEADLCTVEHLRRALCEVIGADSPHVIVDLDSLSFMDASALGVLVQAQRLSAEAGGSLWLRCRNHRGRRLLTMTGLDGMLDPGDELRRSGPHPGRAN